MKVTKQELRSVIREAVRRKLDLGPDLDDWTPRPHVELEGKLTKEQLQQLIDEEFADALARRERLKERKVTGGLYQCDARELLEFAKAYAALPLAVREQLDEVVDNPLALGVNPNAVQAINESLGGMNEELDALVEGYEMDQGGYGMDQTDYGMDEAEDCGPGMDEEQDLDQVTPPGREKQVKALKKQKGVKNPWAVAWASYNKSKGK